MFKRIISLTLTLSFLLQQTVFAYTATLNLSGYLSQGTNPAVSDRFRPIQLRYFSYQPLTNDFQILLDKGDGIVTSHKSQVTGQQLQENTPEAQDYQFKQEAIKLLDYFKIGLSLPNDKFWVNLRPDSPEEIIDPELAQTDLGKVMLEADLKLKQDTALFTSPKTPQGKAYWDKLYKKAGELFGSENITIPTLTRPWIVPGEIILRESGDSAYVYKAGLKVMLEEDYLKSSQPSAISSQQSKPNYQPLTSNYSFSDPRLKELNQYSTQLIRELILPKLTQKVNSSRDYAKLRQVYFSLILARWFKESFRSQSTEHRAQSTDKTSNYINLIDSKDLSNLSSKQAWDKTTYFQAYQKSFKEGEYNLSEPVYTPTGQVIRRYMSGGLGLDFGIRKNPIVGLYTAPKENIANSPIGAGDNKRKVILNIGIEDNQLNIQDPAAVMSGSPINEQLAEKYYNIISDITSDIKLKLYEIKGVKIVYTLILERLYHGMLTCDIEYTPLLKIREPAHLLKYIREAIDFLESRLIDFSGGKDKEKEKGNIEFLNQAIKIINSSLQEFKTLAKDVEKAAQQSDSPLLSKINPEDTQVKNIIKSAVKSYLLDTKEQKLPFFFPYLSHPIITEATDLFDDKLLSDIFDVFTRKISLEKAKEVFQKDFLLYYLIPIQAVLENDDLNIPLPAKTLLITLIRNYLKVEINRVKFYEEAEKVIKMNQPEDIKKIRRLLYYLKKA